MYIDVWSFITYVNSFCWLDMPTLGVISGMLHEFFVLLKSMIY